MDRNDILNSIAEQIEDARLEGREEGREAERGGSSEVATIGFPLKREQSWTRYKSRQPDKHLITATLFN